MGIHDFFPGFSVPLIACLLILCPHKPTLQAAELPRESSYYRVHVRSLLHYETCVRTNTSNKCTNGGASLDVFHKDGPCSKPMGKVDSNGSTKPEGAVTTVPIVNGKWWSSPEYAVTVGLGTPPTILTLSLDTSTAFTWTQCQPCDFCYDQVQPLFKPLASTSFSNITCNSKVCKTLASNESNVAAYCPANNGSCLFTEELGNGVISYGYVAHETLHLAPYEVAVRGFAFGCGQQNYFAGQTAGILGLGQDQFSLMSQTADIFNNVFSYCLPSSKCGVGSLNLGKSTAYDSLSDTDFTPLLKKNPIAGDLSYWVLLTAISVAGKKIPINASASWSAEARIYTGQNVTVLPKAAHEALRPAFERQMGRYPRASSNYDVFDTCYDLSRSKTVRIPRISFWFGDVELPVHKSGILIGTNSSCVCMAVSTDDNLDHALIGNFQLKTTNVVADVGRGRMGFGPGGCK